MTSCFCCALSCAGATFASELRLSVKGAGRCAARSATHTCFRPRNFSRRRPRASGDLDIIRLTPPPEGLKKNPQRFLCSLFGSAEEVHKERRCCLSMTYRVTGTTARVLHTVDYIVQVCLAVPKRCTKKGVVTSMSYRVTGTTARVLHTVVQL